MHKVGENVRVLVDINSLVTLTEQKGDVFKDNQTIRVIDYIADNISSIFNEKYVGKVPNDDAGRISLKNDIRVIFKYLESVSKDLSIAKVVRFEVGEGIEKKEENFAEEVAAQLK